MSSTLMFVNQKEILLYDPNVDQTWACDNIPLKDSPKRPEDRPKRPPTPPTKAPLQDRPQGRHRPPLLDSMHDIIVDKWL